MTKTEATNAAQAIEAAAFDMVRAIRGGRSSDDDAYIDARRERIAAALQIVQREAGRIRSLYLASL